MSLVLTAAICTRNRANWTRKAIESLLAQDLDPERLDILVVDNGSTDNTAAMVHELSQIDSRVRYELVETPGLSRARNRALEVAHGEVVAFLDDDAVAVKDWARLHLETFEAEPDVVATGGRIYLVWPEERPTWLSRTAEGLYAGLDLGNERRDFRPPEIPYGANMAFRRSAFETVAPFETRLGRQGSGLLSGEERDVAERLRAAGGRLVYLPQAAVDHHVLPDRTSRGWFLRRSYDQGRSIVVMDIHARAPRGRAYWAARSARQAGITVRHLSVAARRAAARRPIAETMQAVAKAAQAAGTARESARTAREVARSAEEVTA